MANLIHMTILDNPNGFPQPTNLAGLLMLALFAFLLYLTYSSHKAGLNHIPGPFLARYTNLHAWIKAQLNWGSNNCYLRELHQRYGDVVRVGPSRVSVSNPEAIPLIYGVKASLSKSELIRAAQPLGKGPDNLFSVRDSKTHAQMRKAVANAYAISTIVQYEPRIDDTLHKLCEILDGVKTEINLGQWVQHYVYDVAGNMTYGQPLGYLDQGCDALDLARQTKMLHRYINCTMPMPVLHDIASFIIRSLGAYRHTVFYLLSQRKVRERLDEVERRSDGDRKDIGLPIKPDILAHFIASRARHPGMTEEQIVAHCMVNVVAGVVTSTTSVSNVLRYLTCNQQAQERLYNELLAADVSFPATWRETQSLPYLDGLVREGIRLRGADSFNPNGRVVSAGGLTLPGNIWLPAGTVVGIKPSVASVQERTFGPRPYQFEPERWFRYDNETVEQHRERRARMDRGDMSFSSGTRGCIGKGIALMQIQKLIASVVYRYKLTPRDQKQEEQTGFDFTCNVALRKRTS